jgi:hypothetical protein
MSDQATLEMDALKVSLESALGLARTLKRERDEARDMLRDLLDALENCREDSVELLGEWDWKRGTIPRNDAAVEELECRISVADSVIDKAKEVLP